MSSPAAFFRGLQVRRRWERSVRRSWKTKKKKTKHKKKQTKTKQSKEIDIKKQIEIKETLKKIIEIITLKKGQIEKLDNIVKSQFVDFVTSKKLEVA